MYIYLSLGQGHCECIRFVLTNRNKFNQVITRLENYINESKEISSERSNMK